MADRLTTPSFSLICGGPLYRIQHRLGLVPARGLGVPRRALLFAALAWAPMALLALLTGRFFPGETAEALMQQFAVHARCLLAIPLLVAGEAVAESTIPPAVAHFLRSGLVGERSAAAFDDALRAAARVRDSTIGLVILLGLVVANGLAFADRGPMQEDAAWALAPDGSLLAAGWWYVLVTRPLFSLLVGLWLWRLVVLWVLFRRWPASISSSSRRIPTPPAGSASSAACP